SLLSEALRVPVGVRHRALDGKRQRDALVLEDVVGSGNRVERAGKPDEGRQLVDGLTNLDRLDADIEGSCRGRLPLRQGLEASKHRHSDQLAGLVIQHAVSNTSPKMNRRRISISSGSLS